VLCCVLFLDGIDVSMVTVALRSIKADLHLSTSQLQWVVSGYVLGCGHLCFGVGTHRCAGSNLAGMNLQVALEELLRRLHDIKLPDGADIHDHAGLTRAPLSLPIMFTPGPRLGAVTS